MGQIEEKLTRRDHEIANLVMDVCREFATFGKGSQSVAGNPIAGALEGKPPMFALGVDVEKVIRFVLAHGSAGRY